MKKLKYHFNNLYYMSIHHISQNYFPLPSQNHDFFSFSKSIQFFLLVYAKSIIENPRHISTNINPPYSPILKIWDFWQEFRHCFWWTLTLLSNQQYKALEHSTSISNCFLAFLKRRPVTVWYCKVYFRNMFVLKKY